MMDFDTARGAVTAHLDGLYADEPRSPTVRTYGFDTGQSWAPLIDWDGLMGVYVYLVDKRSGALTPLSFPEFEEVPDPQQVGPWPTDRLTALVARTRLLNHPGHGNQKSHGRKGGVRDALAKATTDDEVSDAAQAEAKRVTGRDIRFDFAGSDVEIAKEHAEGVLRGLERYPDAPLSRVHQGGYAEPEARRLLAATDTANGTMVFTDHAQAGGADAYRQQVADFEQAGHFATGTPMGVAMHEFGHVVAERGTSAAAVSAVAHRLASQSGQSLDDYVGSQISSYATESAHEAAAEAFADVMVNGSGASAASQSIMGTIDAAYVAAGGTISS